MKTMRQTSRRSWIAHRSPIAHRSLVGSLIESLLESLEESRRRAADADARRTRGSWIWGVGLVLAAGSLALASPAGAVLLIDDFSSDQALELLTGAASVSSVAPAPAAIGGERDLEIERVDGTGGAFVDVNGGMPPQGQLLFSSLFETETILRLVWDGEDGDADQIDFDGLDPADLGQGGTLDAFEIEYDADSDTTLSLRVYDASDPTGQTWSAATVPMNETPPATFEFLDVLFMEFTEIGPGGAADFANVGAISLEVAGPPSFDLRFDSIQVVPEPAAASLAGLATLALLARHRRRGGR